MDNTSPDNASSGGVSPAKQEHIGCSTVSDVVTRFKGSQLAWPLPEDMTESQLEALLYTGHASNSHRRMPDFPLCHQELKRKGMTKILRWQEYQQEAGENAYGYSQFCHLYGEWLKQHASASHRR